MGRLAWSQVRFRLARTLALITGMLVAATAFTVLTAASRTAQVRTLGTACGPAGLKGWSRPRGRSSPPPRTCRRSSVAWPSSWSTGSATTRCRPPLDGAGNEQTIRVRDAVTPGGRIAYTYDFGADWQHEITLEKTVPRDHSQQYPVCVAFKGDSPVEYWDEEEPEKPAPFVLKMSTAGWPRWAGSRRERTARR